MFFRERILNCLVLPNIKRKIYEAQKRCFSSERRVFVRNIMRRMISSAWHIIWHIATEWVHKGERLSWILLIFADLAFGKLLRDIMQTQSFVSRKWHYNFIQHEIMGMLKLYNFDARNKLHCLLEHDRQLFTFASRTLI